MSGASAIRRLVTVTLSQHREPVLEYKNMPNTKTILVTGGAGFIGSHLIDRLLGRGNRVVCLDNFNDFYDPAVKRRNIAEYLNNRDFTLVEGDIRDRDLAAKLFSETAFDCVVHLAARAGVRPSLEAPALYYDVNVAGTVNLLQACADARVKKLVFISSSSVYGNNEKVPFSESDPVDNPISPYAATKKAGELACYTYHHLYGIDVACLRLFTVYGPRQRPEMAIHRFAALIDAGRPVPLFGDGTTSRDYTFIDDIIDGLTAAIDREHGYDIYNLGDSNPVELRELLRLIENALGKKAEIERMPMQPGDVERTFADISRAQRALGYSPKVSIEDGIARFIRWFREKSPARNEA